MYETSAKLIFLLKFNECFKSRGVRIIKKKETIGEKEKMRVKITEQLKLRETRPLFHFDIMQDLDEGYDKIRGDIKRFLWMPILITPLYTSRIPESGWTKTGQPLMGIEDTGKEYIIRAEPLNIGKNNVKIHYGKDAEDKEKGVVK